MPKQRRSFSAEFERKAGALVLDQGYSHIEACRSLGVVESTLRRWVRHRSAGRSANTRSIGGGSLKLCRLSLHSNDNRSVSLAALSVAASGRLLPSTTGSYGSVSASGSV